MGIVAPGAGSGLSQLRTSALVLVLAAMVCAANLGYASFLGGRDDNARDAASELQVLSQQLAKFAGLAVAGDEDAFDEFAAARHRIDVLVTGLRQGSLELGVPAYENNALQPGVGSALGEVADVWSKMATDADRITSNRDHVLALAETAQSFNIRVPQISAQLAEVVRGMSDGGSSALQINLANRQIVLADRMSRRVTEILAGGDIAVTAADALQRDAMVFGQVLQGLREGMPDAGVSQVTHPAAVAALDNVARSFADAQKELDAILQATTDLAEIQQSATAIAEDADVLLEHARTLYGSFGSSLARVFPNPLVGLVSGLIAAFALVGVLMGAARVQREALRYP